MMMNQFNLFRLVLLLMVWWDCVEAVYYIPGVVALSFLEGDEVPLMVNKLTSTKTLLPMDYYSLPFCRPDSMQRADENLGQLLAGDRIQNSPYTLRMKQEMFCEQVCISDLGQGTTVDEAIRNDYLNNWIVDNLSAASKAEDEETITTRYWIGFPVGYVDPETKKSYIHNHVNIEIMYHVVETEQDKYRVVRFTVEPFSIKHDFEPSVDKDADGGPAKIINPIASCDASQQSKAHTNWDMVTEEGREAQEASGQILFTYDVTWIKNRDLHWANRWDIYLTMDNAIPHRVHWFSIINSLIVAVVISAVVVVIWKRMVRDISNYRKAAKDGQSIAEEPAGDRCVDRLICIAFCGVMGLFWTFWQCLVGVRNAPTTTTTQQVQGWKAVQADVFRPPNTAPMLLSLVCGTGAQLLCTAFLTIIVSLVGLANPARPGSLLITILVVFALMGPVNGYVTSRLYNSFGGQRKRLASSVAALGFPALAAVVFATIYRVAGFERSTYTVGLKAWGILVALWLGVMTPLVLASAYLGFRQPSIWFPVKPSATPRAIPGSPYARNLVIVPLSLLLCGIFPFGAVFVELYFLLASTWMGQFYYAFGFLLLVFVITVVTCAVMTILFTYMQLRLEDYRWWWRSFLNGGSMALYVFIYSFIYQMNSPVNNSVVYVGYMALVSLGLYCMMGFVGVCASLWFTKLVFAAGEDQESDQPLVGGASKEVELAVPTVV